MTRQTPIDALNGTINTLRYSLARYLRFARPWVDAGAESTAEMIEKVAESHRQHFTRLGELLVERHGHVVIGGDLAEMGGSRRQTGALTSSAGLKLVALR